MMNDADRERIGELVSEHVMGLENLRDEVLEILAGPDTPEKDRLRVERENLDYECRHWDGVIAEKRMAGGEGPATL